MELSLDLTKRYTYADYLTWMDDVRRELIDGFIYMMSAPKRVHVEVSKNIYRCFDYWLSQTECGCEVYYAPFSVRLPKSANDKDSNKIYDVVEPDICVVCDSSKLDEDGCIGAPDLVVEVLSKSTKRKDTSKKLDLYEASGVREYWTVDTKTKIVDVFLLQANGFYNESESYEKGQKIPVSIFSGFEVDVKKKKKKLE
jgi:Uma2 family endonuclease